MTAKVGAFEVEITGETLIVTPLMDLRELGYPEIEAGASEILDLIGKSSIRNIVMDFHKTDYYGSTALGFFVKLWKRVRERQGRMALCCLSEHEREILAVTKLDSVWRICSSRAEAMQFIRGESPG
jgi:anti-sigma B factor antagonist